MCGVLKRLSQGFLSNLAFLRFWDLSQEQLNKSVAFFSDFGHGHGQ
jgi:hypothetical protein